MTRTPLVAATVLAFGLASGCWVQEAQAHLVQTGLGPVYNGIAHFALSPEDILPILAVAIFAGLRGKDQSRRVILVVPATWLMAGLAGLWAGAAKPGVPLWFLLITLGALVAADLRLQNRATTALAAIVAALLGLSDGASLAQSDGGYRELIGIVGSVIILTTLTSAGVLALSAGSTRTAFRVAGSWIAASGLLLLGWSFR